MRKIILLAIILLIGCANKPLVKSTSPYREHTAQFVPYAKIDASSIYLSHCPNLTECMVITRVKASVHNPLNVPMRIKVIYKYYYDNNKEAGTFTTKWFSVPSNTSVKLKRHDSYIIIPFKRTVIKVKLYLRWEIE